MTNPDSYGHQTIFNAFLDNFQSVNAKHIAVVPWYIKNASTDTHRNMTTKILYYLENQQISVNFTEKTENIP